MRKHVQSMCALAFLLLPSVNGVAQQTPIATQPAFTPTVNGEIDLDVRSRVASAGVSNAGIYSTSFRLNSDLMSGLKVHLFGDEKPGVFLPQQATVEYETGANRYAAGIIRIPFGIYDYSETYASGLINYSLPRTDYGYDTVNWGVPGAQWTGGSAKLQIEAAAFSGKASGVWENQNNVAGAAVRFQTYVNGAVIGVSHWTGYYDFNFGSDQRQNVNISGVDIRYTLPHILLRGEMLYGPMGGDTLFGGYLDAYYHVPKFHRVTLTARIEAFRPGFDEPAGKQLTLGIRYAASADWVLVANWRLNNMSSAYDYSWTPFAGHAGDLYFQVYRKLRF